MSSCLEQPAAKRQKVALIHRRMAYRRMLGRARDMLLRYNNSSCIELSDENYNSKKYEIPDLNDAADSYDTFLDRMKKIARSGEAIQYNPFVNMWPIHNDRSEDVMFEEAVVSIVILNVYSDIFLTADADDIADLTLERMQQAELEFYKILTGIRVKIRPYSDEDYISLRIMGPMHHLPRSQQILDELYPLGGVAYMLKNITGCSEEMLHDKDILQPEWIYRCVAKSEEDVVE